MSSGVEALLVALGAAVGAPVRFLVGTRLDGRWPWGTLAVNVAGSFLLGLLVGASVPAEAAALLGVGLCGGLTTFSAFAVQAVERGRRTGTAYVLVTAASALPACALGWWLGSLLG